MKLLKKVKISLLISIGIILLLSIKTFAVTGTITEITVNMRKEPSTDSKKIMYVTQDDKVEVLEKDGEWYKIKFEGKTGYVFGEYVKVDDSKLEQKEEITTTKQEEIETKNEGTENITEEKQEEITNTNLVITSKTQIRIVPNISSSVIYTASKDIQVNIIEQINDWTYVSVGSVLGWVRTDKIVEENEVLPDEKETANKKETTSKKETAEKKEDTTTETTKQETKTAYIKYDTVNLREKASTSAKVLAKLKLNDEVTVLEKVNTVWSKVKVDGRTGYISTELLADEKQEVKKKETEEDTNTTTSRDGETMSREENKKEEVSTDKKEETTTTTTSTKTETTVKEETTKDKEAKKETSSSKVTGKDIIEYAKKYLGYDYVLGGTSPKKGFDCSGFTYYVYKNFGYTISRTSKLQAKDGKEVAKKDLQPGDLIIFKNQSLTAIGHVGIYIGNNKIIHASEPGVGVVITSMDASGYNYNKRYVTARRII